MVDNSLGCCVLVRFFTIFTVWGNKAANVEILEGNNGNRIEQCAIVL